MTDIEPAAYSEWGRVLWERSRQERDEAEERFVAVDTWSNRRFMPWRVRRALEDRTFCRLRESDRLSEYLSQLPPMEAFRVLDEISRVAQASAGGSASLWPAESGSASATAATSTAFSEKEDSKGGSAPIVAGRSRSTPARVRSAEP